MRKKKLLTLELCRRLEYEMSPAYVESLFSQHDDIIGADIVQFLIELPRFNAERFKKLFNSQGELEFECPCPQCGCVTVRKTSKTDLANYILCARGSKRVYNEYLCKRCIEEKERERKQREKDIKDRLAATRQKRVDKYVNMYLDANKAFKPNIKPWRRYQEIAPDDDLIEPIAAYIRSMPYKEFLHTPYWNAVSGVVKARCGYKCQLCGKTGCVLNVHHSDYNEHGYEHLKSKGLICLCQECHERFHTEGDYNE